MSKARDMLESIDRPDLRITKNLSPEIVQDLTYAVDFVRSLLLNLGFTEKPILKRSSAKAPSWEWHKPDRKRYDPAGIYVHIVTNYGAFVQVEVYCSGTEENGTCFPVSKLDELQGFIQGLMQKCPANIYKDNQ